MTNTPKHTPTPWHVDAPQKAFGYEISGITNNYVCQMSHHPDEKELAKANAAYIVRAVNNHEELVTALKGLFALNGITESEYTEAWRRARQALANVDK